MATDSAAVLTSMFGSPDEGGVFSGTIVKEKSMRLQYWRKPDGWITTGPDIMTDAPKYQQYIENKRFKPLPPEFGKEVLGKGDMTFRHRSGQEHYWLKPFMDNGGLTYVIRDTDTFGRAGEYLMPAEQIVALNLHRFPGVKEARPDLAGVAELECPYGCIDQKTRSRRLFSGITALEAQSSLDQHIVAQHKDAVASRAVGDVIADQMKNFQGAAVNQDLIATIAAAVATALTGVQQGAIAAVVQEQQAPEPPFNLNTASRQELMKYASANGIPRPSNAMQMNADQWRDYVRLATETPSDDSQLD